MKKRFKLLSRGLAAAVLTTSLFTAGYVPVFPASAEPADTGANAAGEAGSHPGAVLEPAVSGADGGISPVAGNEALLSAAVAEGPLIARDSSWSYLDDGSDQATVWRDVYFDNSLWKQGQAPLGYANSGKGLDLNTRISYGPDSNQKFITSYYRKEFTIDDPSAIRKLAATLVRDDGAVVYLNGQEVYRTNMPQGTILYKTTASTAIGDERLDNNFNIDPALLLKGTNVIAAEVHQDRGSSSDTFFSLELNASSGATASQDHGLLGQYYTGTETFDFGDYKSTRIDSQINFSTLDPVLQTWAGSADNANIRWTGQIMAPESSEYTFYMIGDNGFRLWLDDQLVIDHWKNDWDVEQTSSPVTLQAGVKHSLKIEYFEDFGGSNLYLRWSGPGITKQIVPASAFYLPANYNGPVSGEVDSGGNRIALQLTGDLQPVPAALADHLTVKAEETVIPVLNAVQGSTADQLTLTLGSIVKPGQIVNVSYDGQAGLEYTDNTAAGSFTYSPDNMSEAVDYSPIAIAMSFQNEAKTNRSFAWYTSYERPDSAPAGIMDSIVEIVPADADFSSPEKQRFVGDPADTRALTLNITGSTKGAFISHKAIATGLAPGTAYKYRVGSEGNWSTAGSFTTEGENEKAYNFLYMTDSQGANTNDYEVWAKTLKNGMDDYPDAKFLVMTGDQVDAGSLESQWLDYFGKPQNILMKLPLMAAVGNHEGPYNDNYYYHFNYPNNSIDDPLPPGSVYSFDYGDAHMMVMNTMDMGWDDRQKNSFKQQIDWLKREVAQTDKKWKVVAFHKAIYSLGGHAAENEIKELRETLYPIFDELGIDVVLQGHDHVYVRSNQMYGNKVVENVSKDGNGNPLNPDGTLYMINNSSGTKFYDVNKNVDPSFAAVYEQPRMPIYSGITMTEDSFTINSYKSGEASPFDTYTIVRDDSKPEAVKELAAKRTVDKATVLTWDRPADRSAEDAIRGFRIYEKNGKLGMNWNVYVPAAEGQNQYEYKVAGTNPAVDYEFVIKAVDKRDNSSETTVLSGGEQPSAPTAPVIDDARNTFGWTPVPGYTDAASYEYSLDAGLNWQQVTVNPQPISDGSYAAGMVQVRIKGDEAAGTPAGGALLSDKSFTLNDITDTYVIEGVLKRENQLQVEVTLDHLTDYSGSAYVVFELLDGDTPLLINALPLKNSKLTMSQYYNVKGGNFRVKVFVFDQFNNNLEAPGQLAKPVQLQ
ncbi:PA14 domain-containing protein [Paenibacillus sp. MMS20-IR301]|uniref:PA14 domain-containing protein n=1 Tax=Paenibacillus sp. MMS20-IR301 TaxID=2895946 RepID=UPI0028E3006C|nr:PA14 domain-containing protein [Paenibacillus sp. MMS20-IR301]WNS41875.1 PA14 domain-containing protein [Paenibacillus sp. MMS20-IR301]